MVPFVDLKAQYHTIKPEIDQAIASVLESSQFVLGKEVASFEEEFARYSQAAFGIGVNSGTSALHLALLAARIGQGDEVITIPFTFVATIAAIRYTGARPVFVDIEPRSFTIDPEQIENAITAHTRAIMPVHLYGQMADMDAIMEIAGRHDLVVIEDAAQAHGAEYNGRRAGSIGDLGCFSFYPGKNLGAYGEGGLVITNNPDYTHTIRMLRDWGAEKKYHHELKGFNYRMEGIQGAILRVKLRYLETWTEARRAHARKYTLLLSGNAVQTPDELPYARHVYHIYAVRTSQRQALQQFLQDKAIQSGIHYPYPVHLMPAHSDLGYKAGDFPNSEKAAQEVLSLPMFAELTDEQIHEVCAAIRQFNALHTT
jgi:dTDP-4-amino-4,6-dideoxygalactose transaminase